MEIRSWYLSLFLLMNVRMELLLQAFTTLRGLIKEVTPAVELHLTKEGVLESMYCTNWLQTLFAYNMRNNFVFRIWDLYLLHGKSPALSSLDVTF